MHMKNFFVMVTLFVVISLVSPLVFAVHVPEIQEDIRITMERGREYSFSLLLRNFTTTTTISSDGNASAWVTFGENNEESYVITNLVDQSLKVTIFVPSNTNPGYYTAFIKANNETISEIGIEVVTELSDAVKDLEQEIENLKSEVSDLEEEQNTLKSKTDVVVETQDRIRKVQDTIEELVKTLSRKIDEMEKYQKDLHELETKFNEEKAALETRIKELESQAKQLEEQNKQLNELTGNLTVRETSFKILLIIIIVGIALSVLLPEQKKAKIKSKFKFNSPLKRASLKTPAIRIPFLLKKKKEAKQYRFTVRE